MIRDCGAIHGFGKQSCRGGFSNSPGTGKKKCLGQVVAPDRIFKGGDNILLTHDGIKSVGSVFARGDNKVIHSDCRIGSFFPQMICETNIRISRGG